jgi:dihydropteroate synthase
MQTKPSYRDVVADVKGFLRDRVQLCVKAGIDRSRIVIDPGFGFGKSVQHNLCLVKYLAEFTAMDLPVLVGFSRKSTIGELLHKPADQRLIGSVTLAAIARWLGAAIFRVHDVRETVEALAICDAAREAQKSEKN